MTPKHASQPLLGDALALISALFYAIYVVFLKVKAKDESRIDMRLFLGFVGLFNALTCWPVGVALHWMGMERFELPGTATQWYALIANVSFLLSVPATYELLIIACVGDNSCVERLPIRPRDAQDYAAAGDCWD